LKTGFTRPLLIAAGRGGGYTRGSIVIAVVSGDIETMADASPFALTEEIAALVAGALDTGNVLLLAVVDGDHRPVLSFRGSTAVFSETQLSFWARNAEGGTIAAIGQNPHVVMVYRSATVPVLQFKGRARVVTDAAERDRAYALAPEREQLADPERQGCAVIVDLDEVRGVMRPAGGDRIQVNLMRG
jgi:hypothetical protein